MISESPFASIGASTNDVYSRNLACFAIAMTKNSSPSARMFPKGSEEGKGDGAEFATTVGPLQESVFLVLETIFKHHFHLMHDSC
jgi:hypothetical protein